MEQMSLADRSHFIALASRMMRHILIDHARSKSSSKRRHHKVEISTRVDGPQRIDLSVLEAALIRLRALDEKLMELVEMRYFGGRSEEHTSELQSLLRISYAVFCLQKKKTIK